MQIARNDDVAVIAAGVRVDELWPAFNGAFFIAAFFHASSGCGREAIAQFGVRVLLTKRPFGARLSNGLIESDPTPFCEEKAKREYVKVTVTRWQRTRMAARQRGERDDDGQNGPAELETTRSRLTHFRMALRLATVTAARILLRNSTARPIRTRAGSSFRSQCKVRRTKGKHWATTFSWHPLRIGYPILWKRPAVQSRDGRAHASASGALFPCSGDTFCRHRPLRRRAAQKGRLGARGRSRASVKQCAAVARAAGVVTYWHRVFR